MDTAALLSAALDTLARHDDRAGRTLNLIASENTCPPPARAALAGDAAHRYFFAEPGPAARWRFPGGAHASCVETTLTVPLLSVLCCAEHVTARPLSGLHAMTVALSALGGSPGSTVVSVSPALGGHYATADLARRLGLRPVLLTGSDPHQWNPGALHTLVAAHRPSLVYLDACHSLFPPDVAELAAAAHTASPDTVVHVDCSHTMGLVLAGALPNPLDAGVDSFGGSVHKTLPGPQKGILATRRPDLSKKIDAACHTLISNHHLAGAAALGIALAVFALTDPAGYAADVLAAARALASGLHNAGLTPAAADRGYTASHQVWLSTVGTGVPGPVAAERLYHAGIHVNTLTDLPGLTGTPALRFGVAEAVTVGLRPADLTTVAGWIADAVLGRRPCRAIAAQVAELRTARTPRHARIPAAPLQGAP